MFNSKVTTTTATEITTATAVSTPNTSYGCVHKEENGYFAGIVNPRNSSVKCKNGKYLTRAFLRNAKGDIEISIFSNEPIDGKEACVKGFLKESEQGWALNGTQITDEEGASRIIDNLSMVEGIVDSAEMVTFNGKTHLAIKTEDGRIFKIFGNLAENFQTRLLKGTEILGLGVVKGQFVDLSKPYLASGYVKSKAS